MELRHRTCQWLQRSAVALSERPGPQRYALAVVLVAGITVVQLRLNLTLGVAAPYLLFHPATVLATWYGGFGAGLLATLLSLLSVYFFGFEATVTDALWWPSLLLFLVVSLFLNCLANFLRLALIEVKSTSERLQHDVQTLEQVYSCITDAFISVDQNWNLRFWNEKAALVFGLPARTNRTLNLWQVLGETAPEELCRHLNQAMADKGLRMFEHYCPATSCWYDLHIYRSASGLSLYASDISERKKLEAELRQAHDHLERYARDLEERVTARTAHLGRLTRELEAFSYSVSHDLRSPLRCMQAYAETLLEGWKGKIEARERFYLEAIEKAARRLDRLIQSVLVYQQLSSSSGAVERVDLDELVRDIINQYPDLQRNRENIHISAPLLPVKADAACLAQCLSNLLENALDLVPPGGVRSVCVSTQHVDHRVRLAIENNRIAVSCDRLQRFFESSNHRSTSYEGTGIGLAIAKKAAERMHGVVRVEPTQAHGACFMIELEGV